MCMYVRRGRGIGCGMQGLDCSGADARVCLVGSKSRTGGTHGEGFCCLCVCVCFTCAVFSFASCGSAMLVHVLLVVTFAA